MGIKFSGKYWFGAGAGMLTGAAASDVLGWQLVVLLFALPLIAISAGLMWWRDCNFLDRS